MALGDRTNFYAILRSAVSGDLALVVGSTRGRPVAVLCALQSDHLPSARYIPLAILVNEYTTDLLNDLVPPPTLHGEWCWTHVPQKEPPSPLVPSEGDAEEGSEPA